VKHGQCLFDRTGLSLLGQYTRSGVLTRGALQADLRFARFLQQARGDHAQ
jgi:hypothetical protein